MLPLNKTNLRGHKKKFFIEHSDKDVRKFDFSMRVRKVWNSLPIHVVNSKDVISFEKNLDDFWKDQPLLYQDFKADVIIKQNSKVNGMHS